MVDLGLLAKFIVDAGYSWVRMFIALGLSIAVSIVVGTWAATSTRAEKIILPITDILQTVPILAFFPLVLAIFVVYLPGYIGINAAVIFLIITSMLWNIIFGVYESIKTISREFIEVADMYRMSFVTRLRKIFIPAAFPRIVQQSILSWSIGLVFLVTSEIFSYGNPTCCHVIHGIGYDIVAYSPGSALAAVSPDGYLLAILVLIGFVVGTRFLFFRPLERYATRYMRTNVQVQARPRPTVSWFHRRIPGHPITAVKARMEGIAKAVQKPTGAFAAVPPKTKAPRIKVRGIYIQIAIIIALLAVFLYFMATSHLLLSYELMSLRAMAYSFVRIWLAFALCAAIGIPICVYLIFFTRHSSKYLMLFQIMASVPATVLLPGIAALFVGMHFHSEIVTFIIYALSGIWYVIFSIIASTRAIPSNVLEVKNVYGVKGKDAWRKIYLKAIVPGFITGALTGIAAEWNVSIVAENFTTSGITGSGTVLNSVGIGIGKLLDYTASTGNLPLLIIALINLIVMIIIINTFVWKRFYRQVSKVYG